MARISVVVPALNEAGHIAHTLQALAPLRASGHEIVVVDGGSSDGTPAAATGLADLVVDAPRGRARQMNAGAAAAAGDLFWFLHADTQAAPGAAREMLEAIGRGACWGRFDVRLSGRRPLLRLVERMMNMRSRLTGIATGDQGIFVTREAFEAAGGFPDIPLMEDIALSRALLRQARPACLGPRLVTSSRRWEQQGVVRTILLMWRLRLAYALGSDPHRLVRRYHP